MSVKILVGDVRAKLAGIEAGSVQCVVSSPPYWALRDYGTGAWEGGFAGCEHVAALKGKRCATCGAKRVKDDQIGLEPTLADWVGTMVGVSRDIRRVLRPDGLVWFNIGDNYAATPTSYGIKPKDLCLQGFKMAEAMRVDGWYLRGCEIWYKPGILPESVTDRPTVTHEYMFMFSKSPNYFYDAEAVRTPTANLRSVWTIQAQSFSNEGEKHHATFPEKLVEPCILASTSEAGACRKCGAPWKRVGHLDEEYAAAVKATRGRKSGDLKTGTAMKDRIKAGTSKTRTFITTGWEPTCGHKTVDSPDACVVLDPFSGSGTTGVVARALGCDYIGIELNPSYAKASLARIMTGPKRLRSGGRVELTYAKSVAEANADAEGDLGVLARALLGGD